MNVLINICIGMIGFLVGNLLFSKVGRWLITIHGIITEPPTIENESKAIRLASATFLSSGPWFAAAVAVFAYYAHAEVWSLPILIGAIVAITFFGVIAIYRVRRVPRSRVENGGK